MTKVTLFLASVQSSGYNHRDKKELEGIIIKPVVLAYNLSPEREKQVKMLCVTNGIRCRMVDKQEYSQPLAALAGLEELNNLPHEGEDFQDEMMVLCFFPNEKVSAFLNAFRQKGYKPVRLKAVLTETNSRWESVALNKELNEEDAWFKANKGPMHSQEEENGK